MKMFIKSHIDKSLLYILIFSIPFIIKYLFKSNLKIYFNSIIESFIFASFLLFILLNNQNQIIKKIN